MYLNTFLNTFLHTPLNINNRSSVDGSANHGFKHFNAVIRWICLLLNNTVLYPVLCYISQLKKYIFKHLIYIVHLYFVQYNVIVFGVVLSTFKTRSILDHSLVRYVLASESQIKVPIDSTPTLSVIIVSTPIFAHSTAKSPYNIR